MIVKSPPTFDERTPEAVYDDFLALASVYFPEWESNWPSGATRDFPSPDPGLALLKLFSPVVSLLYRVINDIPEAYQFAFYQFMGLHGRAPRAAKAFLTFIPPADSPGAIVPAGTRVAVSDQPDIVFSTVSNLEVIPLGLKQAVSFYPPDDSYHFSQFGDEPSFLFKPDRNEQPLVHALYLRDDRVFHIETPAAEISVRLEGANLSSRYFARWMDGMGAFLHANVEFESPSMLEVRIIDVTTIPEVVIDGVASYYVQVRPAIGVRILSVEMFHLPQVSSIEATVTAVSISPNAAFYNEMALEVKNGFFPFGQTPALNDLFYFQSDEVFRKWDADIRLEISLATSISGVTPYLSWEYWDGDRWSDFPVQDGTSALTQSGVVTFRCPPVREVEINGAPGSWIRVRLVAGNYGHEGEYVVTEDAATIINRLRVLTPLEKEATIGELQKMGIAFGYQLAPPTYQPPFIQSFSISYRYSKQLVGAAVVYNAFQFNYFIPGSAPFTPSPFSVPSVVLGFACNVPIETLAGRECTLYFSLREGSLRGAASDRYEIGWKYYDGTHLVRLEVTDGTFGFRQSGVIKFRIRDGMATSTLLQPDDARLTGAEPSEGEELQAPSGTEAAIDQQLFWLAVEDRRSPGLAAVQLKGIYPNSVLSRNSVAINGEVLGSSDGSLDQVFSFSQSPILPGQKIEVREPVLTLEGVPVPEVTPSDEGSGLVWVAWQEVENLELSGSTSRHYVLDRMNGTVRFGNSVAGMIPPAGENNIRAVRYDAGGGERGNVPANRITVPIEGLDQIETVTNRDPALGGADADSHTGRLNPGQVRDADRAVAPEDFDALALQASPEVRRSHIQLNPDGSLSVSILVPDGTDRPGPRYEIAQEVQAYLRKRALFSIADRIRVVSPEYVAVNAIVVLHVLPSVPRDSAIQNIRDYLQQYFNAIHGGPDGTGWDFGARIFLATTITAIEQEPALGIGRVDLLTLNGESRGWLQLAPDRLPTPGTVEIQINYGK